MKSPATFEEVSNYVLDRLVTYVGPMDFFYSVIMGVHDWLYFAET